MRRAVENTSGACRPCKHRLHCSLSKKVPFPRKFGYSGHWRDPFSQWLAPLEDATLVAKLVLGALALGRRCSCLKAGHKRTKEQEIAPLVTLQVRCIGSR